MNRHGVQRLLAACLAVFGALGAALLALARWSPAGELQTWCVILAGAFLLCLAGSLPAWLLSHVRRRALAPGDPGTPIPAAPEGPLHADAGWPQGLAVLIPAGVVLAALVATRPHEAVAGGHLVAAVAALALIFPTLVLDSLLAEAPLPVLPDRTALQRLVRVPIAVATLCGLSLLATSMGWSAAWHAQWAGMALVGLVAAELVLRALVHLALGAQDGASCADSLVAGALLARLNPVTAVAAALRERFGIDLARSWSAQVIAAAAPWVLAGMAIAAWLLTGVSLVPLGNRVVLEGGAAARVLGAGAHLHAPWPFTTRRFIEDGRVHETLLGELELPLPAIAAESEPPAAYDRLWEVGHPAESTFIVPALASAGTGQGFRVVSGDVRVQWSIGASDEDAISAVARLAEPEAALARAARRALTATCACLPLDELMGADRDRLGERLRIQVQADLDALAGGRSGLVVVAVVIDAIHPPVGAATAYQMVQAAEITARATVAKARAAAAGTAAEAAVVATTRLASAAATASEASAKATGDSLRFAAERDAWAGNRQAMATERWLEAIRLGLTGKTLILLDHHLDLQPLLLQQAQRLVPLELPPMPTPSTPPAESRP